MGMFLNPSNVAFQKAVNSKIYVDKTGLLEYTNSVVNTQQAFICNSRPRRFGKSMAAKIMTQVSFLQDWKYMALLILKNI